MNCPRCNYPLRADGTADEGWCVNHGPVFIGTSLQIPPKREARLQGKAVLSAVKQ